NDDEIPNADPRVIDELSDDYGKNIWGTSEWFPCWLDEDIKALFIQFSNRGEWDLGEPNDYESYVHFFTQGDQQWPF
ncbi:MAG: hypothetical protein GTO54_01695, partial [Nitrososphaeria archaeon]|nr:hypothetical protein [Nitrososphaeria archaeon]